MPGKPVETTSIAQKADLKTVKRFSGTPSYTHRAILMLIIRQRLPKGNLFIEKASAEKFQALMLAKDDMAADVGSVIYGEEAVHLGIIDQLGGLREGLDWLYRKMNETRG